MAVALLGEDTHVPPIGGVAIVTLVEAEPLASDAGSVTVTVNVYTLPLIKPAGTVSSAEVVSRLLQSSAVYAAVVGATQLQATVSLSTLLAVPVGAMYSDWSDNGDEGSTGSEGALMIVTIGTTTCGVANAVTDTAVDALLASPATALVTVSVKVYV